MTNTHQDAEEEYVTRLTNLMHESVQGLADVPEPELRVEVRNQIAKARSYGLASEQAIAIYTITAGQLGVDFDTKFPAAHEILTEPGATEAVKADKLEGFTVALFEALEKR